MDKQKIVLVGATGVIGSELLSLLKDEYHVITAGLTDVDVVMDLTDPAAIAKAFKEIGPVDHVVSTAGRAEFVVLDEVKAADFTESRYTLGLKDKLMGQINLALVARDYLSERGSITLTTGTTNDTPIVGGSSLSMVNGALEAWAKAATTEMPRGIRINIVSPSLAAETPEPGFSAFPGFIPVPAAVIARTYLRSIKSLVAGETFKI